MVKTPNEKFQLKKMSFDPTPVLLKMTPISADPQKSEIFKFVKPGHVVYQKMQNFMLNKKLNSIKSVKSTEKKI